MEFRATELQLWRPPGGWAVCVCIPTVWLARAGC